MSIVPTVELGDHLIWPPKWRASWEPMTLFTYPMVKGSPPVPSLKLMVTFKNTCAWRTGFLSSLHAERARSLKTLAHCINWSGHWVLGGQAGWGDSSPQESFNCLFCIFSHNMFWSKVPLIFSTSILPISTILFFIPNFKFYFSKATDFTWCCLYICSYWAISRSMVSHSWTTVLKKQRLNFTSSYQLPTASQLGVWLHEPFSILAGILLA